jgi:AAHS family 4-hydroxybenzoate transporter-like MFS transporter
VQIDIEDFMDRTRMGALHVRVLVLCALVAFLDGYDLQSMASAIPTLAADWTMPPGDLRWIVTAALMGVAGAALFVSPLGDYIGRRAMLLVSFGLVGVATVMTATANDENALFVWRLVTGVGLGASMPNALALAAEYVPASRRIAFITLLAGGLSLGGACSGFLAPALIELGGWRAIFATGGAAMLLLWLPLLALPESPRFMVARAKDPRAVGHLLERLDRGYRYSTGHVFTLPTGHSSKVSVQHLFIDGLAPVTVTLWIIFFLNLGLLFLLASWLPVLMKARGLPLEDALRHAALFQIGGVIGGFLLAWLIKKWGPYVVLITTYAATAATLLIMSAPAAASAMLIVSLLVIGNGVVGGQAALNGLASHLYPTRDRATGVGWALGVGRFGAILAPVIGGAFLGANASPKSVFVLAMLLAACCAAGVAAVRWAVKRRQSRYIPTPELTVSLGNQ